MPPNSRRDNTPFKFSNRFWRAAEGSYFAMRAVRSVDRQCEGRHLDNNNHLQQQGAAGAGAPADAGAGREWDGPEMPPPTQQQHRTSTAAALRTIAAA